MATSKSYYVSDDFSEYIPVTTLNKMERNASKYGWKFTFSADRKKVTVDWGDGTMHNYNLITRD